ncbi:PilZ domain-containing protein [Duganella sp. CF402]|uniref:PilZ domain-containing protein n=1 Tax=unclassified Duganella TaxID=2636909 RepID=UPI0008B28582|nr:MULTISPECIES: PilZ domain-containing protein [unclassified Duganella]RZT10630.1 PilZ domain-containing protein [Duganella sp. BK701]SEL05204.1 PilZ domain-containing protein [Duganella sp. CF402]
MDPRREHVRRLLQADAYITDIHGKSTLPAQIIDISRMGVAFVSDQPMSTDQQFVLNFSFPGSAIRNEITLTVLHSAAIGSHGRFRNGARFIAISEACADRIFEYVTTAPAGA